MKYQNVTALYVSLFDVDVDVNTLSGDNDGTFDIDSRNFAGFLMAVKLIKQHRADVNIKYGDGTLLQIAIRLYGEQINKLRFLAKKMRQDEFGSDSAVHIHLKNYYFEVINFLLTDEDCAYKIDVNAMDEWNHPALRYACEQNLRK